MPYPPAVKDTDLALVQLRDRTFCLALVTAGARASECGTASQQRAKRFQTATRSLPGAGERSKRERTGGGLALHRWLLQCLRKLKRREKNRKHDKH